MLDVSKQIRLNTHAVKSNSIYASVDQRYNLSRKSGEQNLNYCLNVFNTI